DSFVNDDDDADHGQSNMAAAAVEQVSTAEETDVGRNRDKNADDHDDDDDDDNHHGHISSGNSKRMTEDEFIEILQSVFLTYFHLTMVIVIVMVIMMTLTLMMI